MSDVQRADSVLEHHEKPIDEYRSGTSIDPNAVALVAAYEPGSEAEKKFLRKIDMHIVPTIWALYTLSYLDRANIGNAKTGGLQADFHLTSTQYSIVLLVFFISYVIFEIPSNLLLTRIRPSIYLSALCFVWGGVAALMAAPTNYRSLAAVRFCLGIIEAGFAPGVAFYLSSWYRRYELSSRFAIYYTATAVSGAFSGLLAGVITQHLNGARGIQGWQWLFIIEGVGSSFLGCFAWYFLPDWPSTTKWLSDEERILAAQRLAYDGIASTQGASGGVGHWKAVKMCFTDWKVGILIIMYMLCTGAQTIQYFVPTLVGALGWTGFIGQYHTIPLYASAFVFILSFCFLADHYQNKPFFITLAASMGTVFFMIVTVVQKHMVQYVFIILAFGCVYALPPLILTWVPNIIIAPAEKRAVAVALVNALGNSASIYGVFLWPSTAAPRYIGGFSATTVWMFMIAIMAQVMRILLKKYPVEQIDADKVVAAEVERMRQRNGAV